MKWRRRIFLFGLFWICSFSLQAQQQEISGKILNSETREPVLYAQVRNTATRQGTISNTEGFFMLPGNRMTDTVLISFTGYEKKYLAVSDFANAKFIYLQPKVRELESVNVVANGTSYLYKLISACTPKGKRVQKTAKTYYELESFTSGKQAELISGYYNGDFIGYEITGLHLKNASIDLAQQDERLFTSGESSHALCLFKLFGPNEWFPANPFSLKKQALHKQYKVSLDQKYKDENEHPVYAIDFMPRDSSGRFFSGRVWIDSAEGTILRIHLQVKNAAIHPFLAIQGDSLRRVDLDITRSFENLSEQMFFNHMDFKYEVLYSKSRPQKGMVIKPQSDSLYTVFTRAVLYAYDYEHQFLLPDFRFEENAMYSDYRNAIFYNDFFWKNCTEFRLNESDDGHKLFIRDSADLSNRDYFSGEAAARNGFLEHPYILWSKNRIRFRLQSTVEPGTIGIPPVEMYRFDVQLYMDLNPSPNGLNMLTGVVFDHFSSFFNFPPTDTAAICFLNIYYDLMEIQRQAFEKEVYSGPMELVRIRELHAKYVRQMEAEGRRYLKEAEHGRHEKAMLKWNSYVQQALGIDNVAYFGIFRDEKSVNR